jgi:hypothetical protein
MSRMSKQKPLLFSSNPPALNGSGLVCLPLCRQNDLIADWLQKGSRSLAESWHGECA